MKNNRLLIGKMAKLNHTTLATLRHYDKIDLLSPVYVNPETGYRYYDIQQCLAFHIIQHYKALNMSLKEIKELIARNDFNFEQEIYHSKLDEVNQAMLDLKYQKEELERVEKWSDQFRPRPPEGSIQMGYITPVHVYVEKAPRNYLLEDIGSVIYDLSKLEGHLLKQGFKDGYPYHAFITLNLNDIQSHNYRTDKLGLMIYGKNIEKPGVEMQRSNTSVYVFFEDFGKLHLYVDRLMAYCQDHNYTPTGDMICQLMGLLNINDFKKSSEVLRLQIPVTTEMSAEHNRV